jgi:hypothetical protein
VVAHRASIFIPFTFIAGLYGMNVKGMPELEYRYGYRGAARAVSPPRLARPARLSWFEAESRVESRRPAPGVAYVGRLSTFDFRLSL